MKQQSNRRPPKQLRAIQTSRHHRNGGRLHVSAHRHTGHRIHRRHTSYPMLAMIVLVVGVLLASWTGFVTADSFVYPGPVTNGYTVHASVPGPPPTVAATIDTPQDDTVFTDKPIDVSGTCPDNTYVELLRNGFSSGVAICAADHTYTISTDLFSGQNLLVARVHSLTDLPGPDSDTVTVTYNPPIVTPPDGGNTGGGSTSGGDTGGDTGDEPTQSIGNNSTVVGTPQVTNTPSEPLVLKTDFKYQGHFAGQDSTWQIDLEGGVPPYALNIDWGDNKHNVISRPRAGIVNLQHKYDKPGGYHGSYIIKVVVSDAVNSQSFLQLLSIVNESPKALAAGQPTKTDNVIAGLSSTGKGALLKYIWPSYLVVVLMLLCFWLGERYEYNHLKPRLKKTRHA